MRKNLSSGSTWEPIIGYSRGVIIGNTIEFSGTTATKDGQVVGKGDPKAQTAFILTTLKGLLEAQGFRLEDTVRTRMFVTDIKRWEEYARAHGEFFGTIRPATTMVEVSALIDPDHLVEIELTAVKA